MGKEWATPGYSSPGKRGSLGVVPAWFLGVPVESKKVNLKLANLISQHMKISHVTKQAFF